MPHKESSLPADWYAKGRRDLRRAEILLGDGDIEGTGFHLQQAAEKFLKGYLLGEGWKLNRTHDLEALLNEAVQHDPWLEKFRDACTLVTEFYIEERYPFLPSALPDRKEMEAARKAICDLADQIAPASPAQAP